MRWCSGISTRAREAAAVGRGEVRLHPLTEASAAVLRITPKETRGAGARAASKPLAGSSSCGHGKGHLEGGAVRVTCKMWRNRSIAALAL